MNHCITYTPGFADALFRLRAFASRLRAFLTAAVAPQKTSMHAEARFLELADRYSDVISRICYSFADNYADYQDLRQDTLINLWRGIGRFRGDADIATWVYRVTMNTCVSRWRSARSRRERFIPIDSATEAREAESAVNRDDIERLHVLLGTLPALDRSLIILWLEERTYEEIADIAGLKRNTVASRLRRIRGRLAATARSPRL